MKKKQLSKKQQALLDLFNSEIKDSKEIVHRYKGFLQNIEAAKSTMQHSGHIVQDCEQKKSDLAETLMAHCDNEIIVRGAMDELQNVRDERCKALDTYNQAREDLEKYEGLKHLYETCSEKELMLWWKVFTVMGMTSETWLDWKKPYFEKGKVIL